MNYLGATMPVNYGKDLQTRLLDLISVHFMSHVQTISNPDNQ